MTDLNMDACCVHGEIWYECEPCTKEMSDAMEEMAAKWVVAPEPEELWEARMRDQDMHPRDDFDDIWLIEYGEEAEGSFPEWADEPDHRR